MASKSLGRTSRNRPITKNARTNTATENSSQNHYRHETVAQVHKSLQVSNSETSSSSPPVHRKNPPIGTKTAGGLPSREVSVDEESQINSKILNLIESEIKRDDKRSHFTDSRPQSLSFYEDERMPEELSGNLEFLSPEERRLFRHRLAKRISTAADSYDRDDGSDVEEDDVNCTKDSDDTDDVSPSSKRSKRKRRFLADHATHMVASDSREMIIPKDDKHRKKRKKREHISPDAKKAQSKHHHHHRHKHNKPSTNNEIAMVLEELQDDIRERTEGDAEVLPTQQGSEECQFQEHMTTRKPDKIYVQKRNRFKVHQRPVNSPITETSTVPLPTAGQRDASHFWHPIHVAIAIQKYWMRFCNMCHGLLAGLAFCHWLYLTSNYNTQDEEFIAHYSHFSDAYVSIFYLLCTVCLISVFDKVDIAHIDCSEFKNLKKCKSTCSVIILYVVCLLVHLLSVDIDYKFGSVANNNASVVNITINDLRKWNHLSLWRSLTAFVAWIILGFSPQEDMLYNHLKGMIKYLPDK